MLGVFNKKCLDLVNYQDKLYYVHRKVDQNMIKDGFVNKVKELWQCDLVLKNKNENEDVLIFLIEISDAIIIND